LNKSWYNHYQRVHLCLHSLASDRGGTGAPIDSGYTKIYSTGWGGFAAIKADGSITAWGHSGYGGTGAPSDNGYTKIYSTLYAFAALKSDGSITAWGDVNWGGNGAASLFLIAPPRDCSIGFNGDKGRIS
jgi:aryl-alcohol dehydrogenase-like predicted oxidoreductase